VFAKYRHQQPIAEMLRRLIYEARLQGQQGASKKQRALDALVIFEEAVWNPRIFESILRTVSEKFYFDADNQLAYEAVKSSETNVVEAIAQILEQYNERAGRREKG